MNIKLKKIALILMILGMVSVISKGVQGSQEKTDVKKQESVASGTTDPRELFEIGNRLFMEGKLVEADVVFRKGDSIPENILGAATSQRLMGNHQRAISDYTRLIRQGYNLGESYFGRGVSHRALEDYYNAIEDFKMSLKYRKDENTYAGLGELLILTNSRDEARRVLEEGRREFPNSEIIRKVQVRASR